MSDPVTKPTRMLMPLMASALALLAINSVDALVHSQEKGGPALGNLIDFPPGERNGHVSPRLAVARTNGDRCVLDVPFIRQEGGSLIVTERVQTETLTLRLHWAGGRTAPGTDDCGRSADLLLSKRDVTALLYAAGGYGPAR